jgi:hypothetical protein
VCACPVAQLRLSAFNTPYGDAQLDPVGIEHDVRRKLVWAELEHRMKRGLPVQVRTLLDLNMAAVHALRGLPARNAVILCSFLHKLCHVLPDMH